MSAAVLPVSLPLGGARRDGGSLLAAHPDPGRLVSRAAGASESQGGFDAGTIQTGEGHAAHDPTATGPPLNRRLSRIP